jgi:hypothetical protein
VTVGKPLLDMSWPGSVRGERDHREHGVVLCEPGGRDHSLLLLSAVVLLGCAGDHCQPAKRFTIIRP